MTKEELRSQKNAPYRSKKPHSHGATAHLATSPAKEKSPLRLSPGRLLFAFFSLLSLLLFFRNPAIAMDALHSALLLCGRTVIPALFPFMVISELLVSSGIGKKLLRPLSPLLGGLFRLSPAGGTAALLGMLCGFPVGTRCAISALEAGEITPEEAARIPALSGNPSSAFLINAVGVSLFGSQDLGVSLLLSVLLSQLSVGCLVARLPQKEPLCRTHERAATAASPLFGVSSFPHAIRSACFGVLLICAYVVFFSALVACLGFFLEALGLPQFAKAALFCLFELSGGMSAAAALPATTARTLLCAAAAAWSGLSVHFQALSLCEGHPISLRPYFLSKLLQIPVCCLIMWVIT